MFQTEEADDVAKLSNLRSEKIGIQQEIKDTCAQLENVQNTLEEALLQIIQIKARISMLQEHNYHIDKALLAHEKILETGVPSRLGDDVLRPLASVASQNLPLPKYDRDKLSGETSHFNDGALDSGPFVSQNRGFSDSSNGDSFKDAISIKMAAQPISSVELSSVKRPFASAFGANVKESFNKRTGRVESLIPALPSMKSKQPRPGTSKAVTTTKVPQNQAIFRRSDRKYNVQPRKFENLGPMPERWEKYSTIGKQIDGLPIVACRVPLKEDLFVYHNVDAEERFTPKNLMEKIPTVACVIDLTATKRYYDPKSFTDANVQHKKIVCMGHEIPNETVVRRFFSEMDDFLHDPKSRGRVVVVHCTHGLNRTGYLVARYLIVRRGYNPVDAISAFNKARGYLMERDNYLADLNARIGEVCPNPFPLFQKRDGAVNSQTAALSSAMKI